MEKVHHIEMMWELDTINIKKYNITLSTIIDLIEEGSTVSLLFNDVTYINSTGIWYLIDWNNRVNEKWSKIIIVWINKQLLETLKIVWIDQDFEFYSTIEVLNKAFNTKS